MVGSATKFVKQVISYVFVAGVGLAILRLFNYDIFSLIASFLHFLWTGVIMVSDFFSGSATIQDATAAGGVAAPPMFSNPAPSPAPQPQPSFTPIPLPNS